MRMGIKTVLGAVLMQAALMGAVPARAEVSIGVITGYMAKPASERWAESVSNGTASLQTSAADIEAAVSSGDQAEAGKLLAQLYSGAAARKAAPPVYAAPARAAAVSRVTRSSEDSKAEGADSKEEGKDEGKDKEKDKDKEGAAEEVKPAAPAPAPALDAFGKMAADLKALNELNAANAAEAASKEKEDKEKAEALHNFGVWARTFAVALLVIVILL